MAGQKRTNAEIDELIKEIASHYDQGKPINEIRELITARENVSDRQFSRYWDKAEEMIGDTISANYANKLKIAIDYADRELNKLLDFEPKDIEEKKLKRQLLIDKVSLYRDGPGEINVIRSKQLETDKKESVITG